MHWQGGDGGKDVPLKEGAVTDIKIEVTSEDGTIKHYFIHAKRLSAKDAFLNDLQFSVGNLNPAFDPDVLSYSCKFVMTNGDIVLYLYCLLRLMEFYFFNMILS